MKCNNCGHLNRTDTSYCVKCGSPLEKPSSAIKKYKENAQKNVTYQSFSKTQKFIIALVIIGILIMVLSAVTPPELELPNLAAPDNYTSETPIEQTDETINKLNTTIRIGDISAKVGEKVTVNAYISDENGDPVQDGTAGITINNTKYSGQVENGNVNIILPELGENNYETIVVYEGNDKYNPSETRTLIEVNKQNTQIDTQTNDDDIEISLKTGSGETIPDETLTITTDNTQIREQTDNNGKINIKLNQELGKYEIKIVYEGNNQYNPTEKTISVGQDKKNTKIDAQYDEKEQLIKISLTDEDSNKLSDATLTVEDNDYKQQEKTDSNGLVEIKVEEGLNKITIKYDGNTTYNPSETTINTVIDHNNIKENTAQSSYSSDNTTENTKLDTTINIENKDNQTEILLKTEENEPISEEYIKIIIDNGTEINEKTDVNGTIKLNLDLEDTEEIKVIYDGSNQYNSVSKLFTITP